MHSSRMCTTRFSGSLSYMYIPLPCMSPAMHFPCNTCPPTMHAPRHTPPSQCMPPFSCTLFTMHGPLHHICPLFATHTPCHVLPLCHTCPLCHVGPSFAMQARHNTQPPSPRMPTIHQAYSPLCHAPPPCGQNS